MPLCEEWDLPGYAMVVSCTLEQISDGGVGDIEPKLVAELCKWSTMLFPSSSNKMVLVCIGKLERTARMLLVFSVSLSFEFVDDIACCAVREAEVCCSFSNSFTSFDGANKLIFHGR